MDSPKRQPARGPPRAVGGQGNRIKKWKMKLPGGGRCAGLNVQRSTLNFQRSTKSASSARIPSSNVARRWRCRCCNSPCKSARRAISVRAISGSMRRMSSRPSIRWCRRRRRSIPWWRRRRRRARGWMSLARARRWGRCPRWRGSGRRRGCGWFGGFALECGQARAGELPRGEHERSRGRGGVAA